MTATEQRLSQLATEHLGLQNPSLESKLSDAGVSSINIVAFGKTVAKEFNVPMTPEDCGNIPNLREFAKFIDARSG